MEKSSTLMDQVAAPENLLRAWRAVRGNIPRYRRMRSAGPDGVSLVDFEQDLSVQLSTLRHMLLNGRYHPTPPARFSVAKQNGGQRMLCVLNVSDRVVQRALLQTIEPLWEPRFLPCNYGFRPGKSIQSAVICARDLRTGGNNWVVDGDISSFFDSIDHSILMRKLESDITDSRVLTLVDDWLDAGILRNGDDPHAEGWLTSAVRKSSARVRQSLEWVVSSTQHTFDPYETDPYDEGFYEQVPDYTDGGRLPKVDSSELMRRRAAQQMASGGLLMGLGWARSAISNLGSAVLEAAKTPAGRHALQKGVMAAGGWLGVAGGTAVLGYYLFQNLKPADIGILQGSPLSPLFANIYLHSFDVGVTRAGYSLVRFADDWVVLCRSESSAEQAYNQAIKSLAHIHLKMNSEKTRIISPDEPVEWLGCKF